VAEEVRQQVNVEMTKELVEMLDAMCESDEQTRSGFIRMLVKAEHKRRQSQRMLSKTITGV